MGKDLKGKYLAQILGQTRALQILKGHLQRGQFHHAYLFHGPHGTGKALTARAFARAILCPDSGEDACGQCGSCRRFDGNNHPDYTEVMPDNGTLGIDTIREIRRSLTYRPYEAQNKVFLITQGEAMTQEGANSLLKTLEEPPDYAVLILLATNRERLLPTIQSRLFPLQFDYLPEEILYRELQQHLGDDEERIGVVASMSQGSLGLAYTLIEDQEFVERRQAFFQGMDGLKEGSFLSVNKLAKAFLTDWSDTLEFFFQILISFFRDLSLLAQGREEYVLNKDVLPMLKKWSGTWNAQALERILMAIEGTKKEMERYANKQLALEVLLLRINSWRT